MKINIKLFLAEVILSVVLLGALLFSISSFVNFIEFENLKIKIASLQDTASRLRFATIGLAVSSDPTSFIVLDYQLLMEEMDEALDDIAEDDFFDRLPPEVTGLFSDVRESWSFTRSTIDIETVAADLDLRNQAPQDWTASISMLQAVLQESEDTPEGFLNRLGDSAFAFRQLTQRIVVFEDLIGRTLAEMLDAAERFRRIQLILAVSMPAFILLVSLAGILIFGGTLSRKLRRLDAALAEVAGGDFSFRVEMRGRDEFNSLATSINAFTRTLGAKLESFRLIMHEIGDTLTTSIESAQVEDTLLRLAMQDSIADGAALYTVGGESGELVLSVSRGRYRPPYLVSDLPDDPEEEDIQAILRSRIIQPGQTILGESAMNGEARIVRNVQYSTEIDWARPEDDPLFLSSIIVVPLRVGTTVSGVLAITSTRPGRLFSDLEYANMQSFAELAAITLDNIYKYADLLEATQLNRELGIAEEIQQDLLPKRLPRLPGSEVAYLSRSIKGLNGDYFDVYPLGNGKTMLTICEVAGRGVPAGLVMVMIRTILRLVASSDKDAQTIMMELNRDMTRRIAIENYASVGILIIDADGQYTFSSAAHYPLQRLPAGASEYQAIQTEGIPVGIDREARYTQQSGGLGRNDLLLFHTDGIPESRDRDGRVFGVESLLRAVAAHAKESPEDIIDELRTELEYFERGTDQKDDQTVIILKYKGRDAA